MTEVTKGGDRSITADELLKHASADDCWIAIDGVVWDLSEFAPDHPGGAGVITRHAGHDATTAYNSAHPPSLLSSTLSPNKRIGRLDLSTLPQDWLKPPPEATPQLQIASPPSPASSSSTTSSSSSTYTLPDLSTLLSLHDFSTVASKALTPKAFAFYSSAATDLNTKRLNNSTLQRILLRPRILRNVSTVSTSSSLLHKHPTTLPIFISPSALARLAHPSGEKALARAASNTGIIQCISSNASFPVSEILDAAPPTQPFFFQLYVNKDHSKTTALLRSLLALRPRRIAAIILTVDAAVPGKREADERLKADEDTKAPNSGARAKNDKKGGGLGRIMGAYLDSGLHWEDLKWLRSVVGPDMPIILKGIQTAADARMAARAGVQGIIVSNHGGRSLDTSTPSILVLLELRRHCPEVFSQLEVWVDGGIRRGTDILKCLALGAKAVGLGRPFLYSLVYGQEGAEQMVEILRDELEVSMKLMGVTRIEEIGEDCVNTRDVEHLLPRIDMAGQSWLGKWLRSRL